MITNAPLFVVPKPGQPGQWRCIADMKQGGQNACIGPDLVFLPNKQDILWRMYLGGWSGVIDASKFFHNFPTLPSDHHTWDLSIHQRARIYGIWGCPWALPALPCWPVNLGAAFCDNCGKQHLSSKGHPRRIAGTYKWQARSWMQLWEWA